MNSVKELLNKIEESKSIAIITHINPDADALCSLVVLKNIIEEEFEGKKIVDIFCASKIPDFYKPILQNYKINSRHKIKYNLAISIDAASLILLGKFKSIFNRAKSNFVIDHHLSNTKFGDNNIVLDTYASATEVLYGIFKSKINPVSPYIAKLIYTGILTDTVSFTTNISSTTHKNLAEILKVDFDSESVKTYYFKNNRKNKVMLLEKGLRSLKFYGNDKVAVMKIKHEDFEKLEATFEDALGIVDHANNIEGVDIAVAIIEKAENYFYVSLRSKGRVDVSLIAEKFNGGGHHDMAAFQYAGDFADIRTKFIDECEKVVENLTPNTEDEIMLYTKEEK